MKKTIGVLPLCGLLLLGEQPGQAAWAGESPPPELAEITVSARRREELAQMTPAALSVLKGEELDALRSQQVQDLPQYFAGLNANFFHARESALAIRGIGNNTANDGLQGSVGLYLDNVYLGRPGQLVFDLLDIEQLELLKGPQGTLFGKNTSAGVLNINTRAPEFRNGGAVETALGSRNTQQFRAMLNQVVDEHSALRLSAYSTHDDGWLRNRRDGSLLNRIDRQGVRGQWLLRLDDDTRIRAILEHYREEGSTGTLLPYAYGPLNKGAVAGNLPMGSPGSNATTYGALAATLGSSGPAVANPARYEVDLDGPQRAQSEQNAASIQVDRKIGTHRLTAITAWRNWRFSPDNDVDNTSLPAVTGGFNVTEQQFSQEIRLASPLGPSFDYVVGAFYLQQHTRSDNRFYTGPSALALASVPNNATLAGLGEMDIRSQAIFGQATRHLGEQFDLSAGLRLNREQQSARIQQADAVPAFPFSPLFQSYDSGQLSATENSLSGQLTASFWPSEQLLTYLTHASGSKSGGFNLNGTLSPGSVLGDSALRIRPEQARSLELGFKFTAPDRRWYLNGSIFQNRVSDYQATTNTLWAGTYYISYLSNVGDVRTRGADLEMRYRASERFDLRAAVSYLDARFINGSAPTPAEEFSGSGGTASSGYGLGTRSLAGKEVNGAPRWTSHLSGEYQQPLADNLRAYLRASHAWRASTYGDINNSIYSRIPAYGLVNLATGLRGSTQGKDWELSFWVRNLFDKHYYPALVAGQNGYFASAGQPRTLGLSLRLSM